jgi:hypothetical protein
MKKKLLIENDLPDLHDFQKILLLNKGKLDFNDVLFMDSEREGYENVIEVTKHGLLLNFDDLEGFLKFFFPETYGRNAEGGDGEYDAMNYDSMYYGNYDFSYECSERSRDDWAEGYPLSSFCDDAMSKLYELVEIISPQSLKYFKVNGDKIEISTSEGELTRLLSSHFPRSEDEITEIDCGARDYMLRDESSEYLGKKFCNTLKPFGIENWGRNRFTECFKTYFVSWAALVQMYIEKGDFDEEALDVMFNYIERNFKDHPPVYYEIEYNLWDKDKYNEYSCKRYSDYLDELIEEAREKYTPEYLKEMERLNKLGLFGKRVKLPGNNKYYIEVLNLDPETMKVKYLVHQDKWGYDRKAGLTTVDDIITMVTQPGLFDQMDFRVNPK